MQPWEQPLSPTRAPAYASAPPGPSPGPPSAAKLALQDAASDALSTLTLKIGRVNEALRLSTDPEEDVVLAERLSRLFEVAFKLSESPGM